MSGVTVSELKAVLGEVVDLLPERESEVITALYWECLSLQEVAERLGTSKSRVRTLQRRAFNRIRKLVDE